MPAPLKPHLFPVVLHDVDAIPFGTASNPIFVTGGGTPSNRGSFVTNQKNVAIPGTAVQLQTQAIPNGFTVYIRARSTNTGNVYVGSSAANAQNHAVAEILEPGAFLLYGITNSDLVFLDADVAGEGVMWTVET
jgi:hypothetical protein